jgi:SnoaL-like protein
MSFEVNKAILLRAYEEGMNKRNMSIIDELSAPDYRAHFPGVPPIEGVAAAKELIDSFLTAFQDIASLLRTRSPSGEKVATAGPPWARTWRSSEAFRPRHTTWRQLAGWCHSAQPTSTW